MENASSTERGSAGIEMILWSLLLLIFVAMPFISGIFEIYHYAMKGIQWSAATENALDQLEWQLETQALAECRRDMILTNVKGALFQTLEPVANQGPNEQWAIDELAFVEGEPPQLEVTISVAFEPVTMVGAVVSNNGKLLLRVIRRREFPIDN